MRSPRTRRCVVPLCTALVFTGLALHCSGVSARARAKVNERLDARPGSVRIDLSRPGAGTATVPELVRAHHHGIGYVLDLGAGPPVDADALRGLLGTIRVTDAHGNTVEEARFDDGLKFGDIGPPQELPQALAVTGSSCSVVCFASRAGRGGRLMSRSRRGWL